MKVLMGRLCVQVLEVPKVVVSRLSLRNLVVWLGLAGMDEIRKLECILDEEYRDIVSNHVPITLGCVVLQTLSVSEMHRTSGRSSLSANNPTDTQS